MADSSFDLHSLLPQRGPLEGFQKAASDPAAFSAAFIWGIIFFGAAVFLWVLCQWALVWWRTRRILKQLNGVTPENATEQRERLRQHGDVHWQEFDSTLVEDYDFASERVWLRRTVDAAQIFNERSLARRLIHSRLISATSGLLTALGVLGAFRSARSPRASVVVNEPFSYGSMFMTALRYDHSFGVPLSRTSRMT